MLMYFNQPLTFSPINTIYERFGSSDKNDFWSGPYMVRLALIELLMTEDREM